MTQAEFSNALRILTSIDMDELERAGIIAHRDLNAWGTFRRDPFRWFVRADDDQQEKLWRLIEARQLTTPAPDPRLAGGKPVVVYFRNESDRREFIEAIKETHPGMVECAVP